MIHDAYQFLQYAMKANFDVKVDNYCVMLLINRWGDLTSRVA